MSPETAQPLDELKPGDRRRLERLMKEGMVREASPGRYYFDRAGEQARMRARMPWLLFFIVVLLLLALWLYYTRMPRVHPLP